jgi:hypothetical protein
LKFVKKKKGTYQLSFGKLVYESSNMVGSIGHNEVKALLWLVLYATMIWKLQCDCDFFKIILYIVPKEWPSIQRF